MTAPAAATPVADRATWLRLLALYHPLGAAGSVIVLGEGGSAIPVRDTDALSRDLVVVRPSRTQGADPAWLGAAVQYGASVLAPDGVMFLYVPRSSRGRVPRQLAAAGLAVRSAVLHSPTVLGPRLLVSQGAALTYAVSSLELAQGWKRRVAALLFRSTASGPLVSRLVGPVALVAQNRDAPPLLDWVFRVAGRQGFTASAAVSADWRNPAHGSVVLCFDDAAAHPGPSIVAKVAWHDASVDRLRTEEVALREVAPRARCARVSVPSLLSFSSLNDRTVLVETGLEGERASNVIRSSPHRWSELLDVVTEWLECWSVSSAAAATVDDHLAASVLRPLESVDLPPAERGLYAARLRSLVDSVRRQPCPTVAAHNDLTMWNILQSRSGALGVADWEAAQPAGNPLTDFFYAAADAVAAMDGYVDRAAAVRECFAQSGSRRQAVKKLERRLQRALNLSAPVAELCFHACWLHHAGNEAHTASVGDPDPRPFREIVRWLARNDDALAVGT